MRYQYVIAFYFFHTLRGSFLTHYALSVLCFAICDHRQRTHDDPDHAPKIQSTVLSTPLQATSPPLGYHVRARCLSLF